MTDGAPACRVLASAAPSDARSAPGGRQTIAADQSVLPAGAAANLLPAFIYFCLVILSLTSCVFSPYVISDCPLCCPGNDNGNMEIFQQFFVHHLNADLANVFASYPEKFSY